MAASSDLQALQLQNRNLQQKLDWKQLKINQRDKHIRDLRDGGLVADLERLERSISRLSLQMEHVQLVIKNPEWGVSFRPRARDTLQRAARPAPRATPRTINITRAVKVTS